MSTSSSSSSISSSSPTISSSISAVPLHTDLKSDKFIIAWGTSYNSYQLCNTWLYDLPLLSDDQWEYNLLSFSRNCGKNFRNAQLSIQANARDLLLDYLFTNEQSSTAKDQHQIYTNAKFILDALVGMEINTSYCKVHNASLGDTNSTIDNTLDIQSETNNNTILTTSTNKKGKKSITTNINNTLQTHNGGIKCFIIDRSHDNIDNHATYCVNIYYKWTSGSIIPKLDISKNITTIQPSTSTTTTNTNIQSTTNITHQHTIVRPENKKLASINTLIFIHIIKIKKLTPPVNPCNIAIFDINIDTPDNYFQSEINEFQNLLAYLNQKRYELTNTTTTNDNTQSNTVFYDIMKEMSKSTLGTYERYSLYEELQSLFNELNDTLKPVTDKFDKYLNQYYDPTNPETKMYNTNPFTNVLQSYVLFGSHYGYAHMRGMYLNTLRSLRVTTNTTTTTTTTITNDTPLLPEFDSSKIDEFFSRMKRLDTISELNLLSQPLIQHKGKKDTETNDNNTEDTDDSTLTIGQYIEQIRTDIHTVRGKLSSNTVPADLPLTPSLVQIHASDVIYRKALELYSLSRLQNDHQLNYCSNIMFGIEQIRINNNLKSKNNISTPTKTARTSSGKKATKSTTKRTPNSAKSTTTTSSSATKQGTIQPIPINVLLRNSSNINTNNTSSTTTTTTTIPLEPSNSNDSDTTEPE